MKFEIETEVNSKNTPAITDCHHRSHERQQIKILWDYDFKYIHIFFIYFVYQNIK